MRASNAFKLFLLVLVLLVRLGLLAGILACWFDGNDFTFFLPLNEQNKSFLPDEVDVELLARLVKAPEHLVAEVEVFRS